MMLPQRFSPVFISQKKSTPWNKNLEPPNFQKSTPNFQKSTPNFYPERSNYFQPLLPRLPAPSRLGVARIRALSPPPPVGWRAYSRALAPPPGWVSRVFARSRPPPVGWRAYSRALVPPRLGGARIRAPFVGKPAQGILSPSCLHSLYIIYARTRQRCRRPLILCPTVAFLSFRCPKVEISFAPLYFGYCIISVKNAAK